MEQTTEYPVSDNRRNGNRVMGKTGQRDCPGRPHEKVGNASDYFHNPVKVGLDRRFTCLKWELPHIKRSKYNTEYGIWNTEYVRLNVVTQCEGEQYQAHCGSVKCTDMKTTGGMSPLTRTSPATPHRADIAPTVNDEHLPAAYPCPIRWWIRLPRMEH